MMHYYINQAPYPIRLLSSLFLFFALSGQVVVVLYGVTRFGLSPEGAKSRYAGDEEPAELAKDPTSQKSEPKSFDDDDEPEINLTAVKPPEPKKQIFFAISWDELLRLTHVHTFAGGMLFYIFGHLFVLTTTRPRLKYTLLVIFFLSIATFIVGPFLVRYVTHAAVYPLIVSIFTFVGCGLFFAARALWDMWGPPSKKPVAPKKPGNN